MDEDNVLKEKIDEFMADKNKAGSLIRLCHPHINTGGGLLWVIFNKYTDDPNKIEYSFIHKNSPGWNSLLEMVRQDPRHYNHQIHYLVLFSRILEDESARSKLFLKFYPTQERIEQ